MAVLLNRLRDFDRARLPPIRQPGLETTGAAPLRFGGRGYGNTAREALGMPELDEASRYIRNDGVGYERLPGPSGQVSNRLYGRTPDELATAGQMANISSAMSARARLSPNVQQIATIQPDSPLPEIQGADYTRMKQTEGAILASARPQLDPANVRQAFSPQNDPLAEKKAAEAAMGRTVEATVDNMRLQAGRPRTQEDAARILANREATANANLNNAADRRAALALESRKGVNEANNIRAGLDAQRQDDLIRRELKIERPALPSRDATADAYLDGVRRGASAALRPPAAADTTTPGNYPENADASVNAPPQDYIDLYFQDPTPEKLKKMQARFPGFDPKRYQK